MVLNLFIMGATGNVGRSLIKQIIEKGDTDYSIHVNPTKIVGLASSEKYIYLKEGISKTNAYNFIDKKGSFATKYQGLKVITSLMDQEEKYFTKNKLVFVDVTALKGDEINKFHLNVIENTNYGMVTANKNPISLGNYNLFQKLTQDPIRYGYRCTVMAGADTVSLIQDLRDMSDNIFSLGGCFSGTIGYITSELEKDKKFSDIVRTAKEQGYTEPHPRDDLNGLDIARKLLILARGLGYNLEISDVNVEPLVSPELLKEDNVDVFLDSLHLVDDIYEEKVKKAESNGKILRYVASMKFVDGLPKLNVSMEEVKPNSPLGSLEGTLNKIVVKSNYYTPHYAIEAPGAGSEVTAGNLRRNLLYLLDGRKYLI